jgi:hypothetical protein
MRCMAREPLIEETMQASLHDIVHNLTIARAHADLLAEDYPEHQAAVLRFTQGMYRAQRQLLAKVRPELYDFLSGE